MPATLYRIAYHNRGPKEEWFPTEDKARQGIRLIQQQYPDFRTKIEKHHVPTSKHQLARWLNDYNNGTLPSCTHKT